MPPCPTSTAPKQAVHRRGVEIDGCTRCHHVWLDRGEREGLTRPAQPGSGRPADRAMTATEANRVVAEAQSKAIGERHAREERVRRTAGWLRGASHPIDLIT